MTRYEATTISGARTRLHEDMLRRILRKHGELNGMEERILDAVRSPDLVVSGYDKELLAIRHYSDTPLGAKDMVVVYREDKQLIITAFLTSDRSKLLKRNNSTS